MIGDPGSRERSGVFPTGKTVKWRQLLSKKQFLKGFAAKFLFRGEPFFVYGCPRGKSMV